MKSSSSSAQDFWGALRTGAWCRMKVKREAVSTERVVGEGGGEQGERKGRVDIRGHTFKSEDKKGTPHA